jgi:hypothetical protein
MVTTYDNSTLAAFVNTNGERHFLPVTAIAANLTRVSRINSFKRPASVFSFAFRHREKASPSYIADGLRETPIIDHPANVQIFDRDHVKAPNQVCRNLVMKILATARDFQMRFGDFDSLLCTALRSLLFAGKPSLLPLEIIQRALEMARVFNLFTVAQCGETGNADIYADRGASQWEWVGLGYFTNKLRIPAVNAACNAKLFALSFNWTAQPDAATANAGDCKFVAFERARSDAFIFLRKGMITIFALVSGKAWLFAILDSAKEAFKRFINTFNRVLLNASQVAFHFWQRARVSQMARLLDIAERLTGDLVTRYSLGKGGVVDLARVFKLTLAGFDKAFVDAKLELESLDCGIFRIGHHMQCLNRYAR